MLLIVRSRVKNVGTFTVNSAFHSKFATTLIAMVLAVIIGTQSSFYGTTYGHDCLPCLPLGVRVRTYVFVYTFNAGLCVRL